MIKETPQQKHWNKKKIQFHNRYYKGVVCHECGSPDVHFHHKDPKTKKFAISRGAMLNSITHNQIIAEIKKCIPLCPYHHRLADAKLQKNVDPVKKRCKCCLEEFDSQNSKQIFCSKCSKNARRTLKNKQKIAARPKKKCVICGNQFTDESHSQTAKYCGKICKRKADNINRKKKRVEQNETMEP